MQRVCSASRLLWRHDNRNNAILIDKEVFFSKIILKSYNAWKLVLGIDSRQSVYIEQLMSFRGT